MQTPDRLVTLPGRLESDGRRTLFDVQLLMRIARQQARNGWYGDTPAQIAAHMGVSVAHVRTRLNVLVDADYLEVRGDAAAGTREWRVKLDTADAALVQEGASPTRGGQVPLGGGKSHLTPYELHLSEYLPKIDKEYNRQGGKWDLSPLNHPSPPNPPLSPQTPQSPPISPPTSKNLGAHAPEILGNFGRIELLEATPAPPKPPPAQRGSRLPDDWTPSPRTIEWYREKFGNDRDRLNHHIEQFSLYWQSDGRPHAIKKNWDKAFQFWVNRAENDKRTQRPSGNRPLDEHECNDAVDRVIERLGRRA